MKHRGLFNTVYNVKCNKQFLIFTKTASSQPDPPIYVNFLTQSELTLVSTRLEWNSDSPTSPFSFNLPRHPHRLPLQSPEPQDLFQIRHAGV